MTRRIVLGSLWAIGLFATFCHYVPVLKLSEVRVDGAIDGQSQQLASLLEREIGSNLLDVDLEGWASRIAVHPAVASVRTRITLTGRAVAHVTNERPVALVDTDPASGTTRTGVLLPLGQHLPEDVVPLITGVGGDPAYYLRSSSSTLSTALAFLNIWQEHADAEMPDLMEIHVTSDSEVDVYLWPDRLYVRLGRGMWKETIQKLWPVLSRLAASERSLDLRFRGQVVEAI
jgi:hypothetical protein